jgi:release factor glutamine methyltransferase
MRVTGIRRPARPLWRRAGGRALKRLLAWRYRRFRPGSARARLIRVAGLRLRVAPTVFDPGIHFTSGFLATYLGRPGVVPRGGSVLDIGAGSGIAAIAAARAGAGRVVAVDINPAAVRCAAANARRYRLGARVTVREGDMFAPVAGERFDLIVCNPPYFRGAPGSMAERAYYGGAAYEWLDRFAAEAPARLAPGGRALLVLGDAADVPAVLDHLAAGGRITQVAARDIWVETLYIFALAGAAPEARSGGSGQP